MYDDALKWLLFALLALALPSSLISERSGFPLHPGPNACLAQAGTGESADSNGTDIRWFREEMKISAKYLERKEGILGMSWPHFFVMLFLVLFFLGATAAFFLRHRRTKQILEELLREEKKNM